MGVSYDVLSLHNSVFRQIVPSELLVHMGLLDHHHLFNHNHKSPTANYLGINEMKESIAAQKSQVEEDRSMSYSVSKVEEVFQPGLSHEHEHEKSEIQTSALDSQFFRLPSNKSRKKPKPEG